MARSDTLIEIGQNFRFEQQKKSEIQAQILIFDLSTCYLWLNFQICITYRELLSPQQQPVACWRSIGRYSELQYRYQTTKSRVESSLCYYLDLISC